MLGGRNLNTIVFETGRPARIDSYADATGPIGAALREGGVRSAVGTPIIVEGRLWGMMAAGSSAADPMPADTEARLTQFTELLATAIANADSRAEVAASRARIVAAADETRRRIERDLHDGAQQQLVTLVLELRAAQAIVPPELGQLDGELSRVVESLASLQDELREMGRGIHPAILTDVGLGGALKTLARRSPIPVKLDVRTHARLPEGVEVAAYYAVSEALTNAAKHAQASVVHVEVEAVDDALRLCVRDDGAGGADPARGSGLIGLRDRVETLGGSITVQSEAGAGTSVHVELPLTASDR
jgi:signal transduction histidine kinase